MTVLILLVVSFVAATISGAAGFGGGLILLPVLNAIVGIKASIPILTIGQIFGNASRAWFGRNELHWRPILYFIATSIPFSIAGSYLFSDIDSKTIKIGIGVFLILMLFYRRLAPKAIAVSEKGMLLGGGLTGFISGIAGSAGPLGAAFFLGLNLPPTAYIATEAFAALTTHLTKIIVYNRFALVGKTELYYGLLIGLTMIAGSWAGKKIIQKLSRHQFLLIVETLLLLSAIQLIWAPG